MVRDRRVVAIACVIALVAIFAAGWLTGRLNDCERFAIEVEGYISALEDRGVPDVEIAPETSAAFLDEQPDDCDLL